MVLGKLDSYMSKNETRTLCNSIHKNKLKMDWRFKYKARIHKVLKGKYRQYTLWHISQQNSLWPTSAVAAAKSLQSCLTLCDPIDSSPLGSSVPGILQARILEWVAISFSNAWKWKVKVKTLSCARLFVTPWTAVYQAPPSIGFSRLEYWSGVPLPSWLTYL